MKGRIKLKIYVKLDSGRSFKILAPIGIVKESSIFMIK